MIKLSIIIPYHKTLDLLKELLNVLIPQLTNECELIIVDDDVKTFELDKYIKKNINIIHHQENSGCAGKPRNTGLDNAKGKYVRFIDADDTVPNYFIDKIMKEINTGDFDYSIDSWEAIGHPTIKKVWITDLPPAWNTSIWNGTYNVKTIGSNRFDETKLIAEDEDFNNRVRKGKKINIEDIMYYYRVNVNDSLTKRYSRGEINKDLPQRVSLLLYQKAISEIGGVEKFINEFCKQYKDMYDITLVYSFCDRKQLRNLSKLVRCIKYNDQKFICEKYLCVSNQENIADNVESTLNWYADMIHADYTAMKWPYRSHPKTNVHIAVSEVARQSFINQRPNEKCEVIYNLLTIGETKPVLRLITCARMDSPEKCFDRVKIIADRINVKNQPLVWEVFTERAKDPIKGVAYLPTVLNIDSYIADAKWYVSTSRTESWGYSTAQALELGIPVISFDYPAIHEQGLIEGVNGYIIKDDLSNLDEIIDKMINTDLRGFKYKKKDNPKQWINLLGDIKKINEYKPKEPNEIGTDVEVVIPTYYSVEQIKAKKGDTITIIDKERLTYLINIGYVTMIEE